MTDFRPDPKNPLFCPVPKEPHFLEENSKNQQFSPKIPFFRPPPGTPKNTPKYPSRDVFIVGIIWANFFGNLKKELKLNT